METAGERQGPDSTGGVSVAVKVNPDECVGCESCVPVCPVEAITMVDGKAVIDPEKCNECGTCIDE